MDVEEKCGGELRANYVVFIRGVKDVEGAAYDGWMDGWIYPAGVSFRYQLRSIHLRYLLRIKSGEWNMEISCGKEKRRGDERIEIIVST